MARIVSVYTLEARPFVATDMSVIRWLKIAEALARLGHEVDIATNETLLGRFVRRRRPVELMPRLRRVPLHKVVWSDYDVVKAVFHKGFESLDTLRGSDHPFIITKLGAVVGPTDLPGIYFYGRQRERLFSLQQRIARSSRYVTVLSRPAAALWKETVSARSAVLLVPGGVDCEIPGRAADPYPTSAKGRKRCLFAGNIYSKRVQPEAHRVLVGKLNALGRALKPKGIDLYFLGSGDTDFLESEAVTHLGAVPYEVSWQYLFHATVGTVVSAGDFMHNNESSKIYHYLRAGLPVVSEAGFPNDNVVREANLGFVVEDHNMESMADRIAEAADSDWDRGRAVKYIIENHTWDQRVRVYHDVISDSK